MTTKFIVFSLITASACAQPAVQPPHLGFATASGGTVRPVYGVAGNFVLGPSIAASVISQAFSGSLGLLKTDSALSSFDAQGHVTATTQVAPGPALFAFSPDGRSALAYIPGAQTLLEFQDGRFETLPFHPALSLVAIAFPTAFEAYLFYQGDDIVEARMLFERVYPTSRTALAGVTAPVLPLGSGTLVFTDPKGIVLRHPDHSDVHIPAQLPAKFSLQQMSADWVQLTDSVSGRQFAIRITPGREAFYQLPETGR